MAHIILTKYKKINMVFVGMLNLTSKTWDFCTYTSSYMYPFKKVFLQSKWWIVQLFWLAKERTILKVSYLVTNVKFSS